MNRRKIDFANALYKTLQTETFSSISISNVCKSMDCSRQSFYYYFKSLEECLAYFIKENSRVQIREDHLISDTFTFVEQNKNLIKICESDKKIENIFWNVIGNQLKKQLDVVLAKSLVEYLSLYPDQKEILICFYVAGIIQEAKQFYRKNDDSEKAKYVGYCKAIFGTYDDMRNITKRFICI